MPSPQNQQAVPDAEAWMASLTRAFEVLLGQPLDTFDPDATYALPVGELVAQAVCHVYRQRCLAGGSSWRRDRRGRPVPPG
jgi:hypothetical protein